MTHNWFQRLLGRADITDAQGNVYMKRWRLLYTKWGGIRIHKICRSDNARDMHDHPWAFHSFILCGGYWEHTLPRYSNEVHRKVAEAQARKWHGAGSLLFRRATDLHRLELKREYVCSQGEPCGYIPASREKPVWTLVFTGPVCRRWGFQTQSGWVDAEDYEEEESFQ